MVNTSVARAHEGDVRPREAPDGEAGDRHVLDALADRAHPAVFGDERRQHHVASRHADPRVGFRSRQSRAEVGHFRGRWDQHGAGTVQAEASRRDRQLLGVRPRPNHDLVAGSCRVDRRLDRLAGADDVGASCCARGSGRAQRRRGDRQRGEGVGRSPGRRHHEASAIRSAVQRLRGRAATIGRARAVSQPNTRPARRLAATASTTNGARSPVECSGVTRGPAAGPGGWRCQSARRRADRWSWGHLPVHDHPWAIRRCARCTDDVGNRGSTGSRIRTEHGCPVAVDLRHSSPWTSPRGCSTGRA